MKKTIYKIINLLAFVFIFITFIRLGLSFNSILISFIIFCLIILFNMPFIYALRGIILIEQGKTDLGLPYLIKAIKFKTIEPNAYVYYSTLLLKDGKSEQSLEVLEKALKLKPKPLAYKNIQLNLSTSYWLNGNINKSIEVLEELNKKYNYINPQALVTLGYMYLLNNELDKSTQTSLKALEDNENYSAAYDNLGQVEYLKENYELAKEYFIKAITIKEDLVDSLFYLGLINEKEGNIEEAKKYYIRANDAPISYLNTIKKEDIIEKLK